MATAFSARVDGTALPEGVVSFSRNEELLWSEGTGRAANSGLMVGSVVAPKTTYMISWGPITQADYAAIVAAFPLGFFAFSATAGGGSVANVTAYRGTIAAEYMGMYGGEAWWKGVSVEIIER